MKLWTLGLVVIMILVCGVASAMDIWIEAFQYNYSNLVDTLDLGYRYGFSLKYYNNDYIRTTWTTPFRFYGTGTVSQIAYQDTAMEAPFENYCTNDFQVITESWGDGVLPDQHCIHCRGFIPPIDQVLVAGRYVFGLGGDPTTTGDFCIEIGDFPGEEYDWLFQPPEPTFETLCLPVVPSTPITICGDFNCDNLVNLLDIMDFIGYLYHSPEPCDDRAADADGNYHLNILDITRLIDYLYQNGPDLTCAFEW